MSRSDQVITQSAAIFNQKMREWDGVGMLIICGRGGLEALGHENRLLSSTPVSP